MANKKFNAKRKQQRKAIKFRDEIFKFLLSLSDYQKHNDLKGLNEFEIQEIRNKLIKQIIDLSKRFNLPITKEIKMHYCKNCGSFLIEGANSSTRMHKSMIIQTCKVCNHKKRIPIKPAKSNKLK